ncbi:thrombospondin type 3 repeat-containing protein [Reyranella sp.]|uniref:thrombospondin type 3 repeat-containing protein n=1 Tax=Reyranella sp. TaxID=1929291 RepID=UPI003BA98F6D
MRKVKGLAALGVLASGAGCVEMTGYPGTSYGAYPGYGQNYGSSNGYYGQPGYGSTGGVLGNLFGSPGYAQPAPIQYAQPAPVQYVPVPVASPQQAPSRYYGSSYRTQQAQQRRAAWGRRDGDGDGIPNRYDKDRNNDGIPDRQQRRSRSGWGQPG